MNNFIKKYYTNLNKIHPQPNISRTSNSSAGPATFELAGPVDQEHIFIRGKPWMWSTNTLAGPKA